MIPEFTAQYGKLEEKLYWYKTRRWIIESLLNRFDQSGGADDKAALLDIGCGSAVDLSHFSRSFDCVGIESSTTLAQRARDNSGVEIIQQAIPVVIPSLENKFDFILMLDVLEHINDDVLALESIVSWLKAHGKVIINVPASPQLWSILDEANEHKRRYTKKTLLTLFDRAGWQVRYCRYWASAVFPLMYLQRRFLWRGKTGKEYRTHIPSPVVNNIVQSLLQAEFRMTEHLKMPFGVSLLAVIEKK